MGTTAPQRGWVRLLSCKGIKESLTVSRSSTGREYVKTDFRRHTTYRTIVHLEILIVPSAVCPLS